MPTVAGVDGCPGGWIVVLRNVSTGGIEVRRVDALSQALSWADAPDILCVDVPIGLLDHVIPGGRECDRAARRFLGHPRGSSVFSPPVRATLAATTYMGACRANAGSSPHGLKLSKQCFGIVPKIQEVDALMTPALQGRVVEVHPEVTFREMGGGRALPPKKRAAGRNARATLIESEWGIPVGTAIASRPRPSERDDVIDAMAACWTAERVLQGRALRLPVDPPLDSRGLRMEIVR